MHFHIILSVFTIFHKHNISIICDFICFQTQ
jgi:hypothetical protein